MGRGHHCHDPAGFIAYGCLNDHAGAAQPRDPAADLYAEATLHGPNIPVSVRGSLHWDVLRLSRIMKPGFKAVFQT